MRRFSLDIYPEMGYTSIMQEVQRAVLYGDMGSLGKASNKLIRQFNFPFQYEDDEHMAFADHDRLIMWDYKHAMACFTRHMNTGDLGLESWVQHVCGEQVIELFKDLFKVDESESYSGVEWTGFRITGTVNRSNGNPVYSLWLFSKREGSATKVYSGERAPNVEGGYASKYLTEKELKYGFPEFDKAIARRIEEDKKADD